MKYILKTGLLPVSDIGKAIYDIGTLVNRLTS